MINKRIWQVSLVVGALMAITGVAAASEHEDTEINYGYDEESQILVFNTSSTDGAYVCTLQTSPTNTEYEVAYVTSDGIIEVSGLTSGGADIMFEPRPAEELGEDTEPATEPGDYETATECQLQATQVTGPAGQVNHGMFMKALNSLYDGPHRGCVVRHFAQFDLGKGDQQILASDADPNFEPGAGEAEFTGTVEFTSIVTDCERKTEEDGEAAGIQGNGKGKGRPEWAGQKGGPNSAGQSGSAPGRDR